MHICFLPCAFCSRISRHEFRPTVQNFPKAWLHNKGLNSPQKLAAECVVRHCPERLLQKIGFDMSLRNFVHNAVEIPRRDNKRDGVGQPRVSISPSSLPQEVRFDVVPKGLLPNAGFDPSLKGFASKRRRSGTEVSNETWW